MMLASWLLAPAVLVGPAAEAPPPTSGELQALFVRLQAPSAQERSAAALSIAAPPPSGLDAYAQRLRRPRTVAAETFRQLILEIWAQVPDPNYAKTGNLWLQKPEPPWKPQPAEKGRPGGQ